MQKEEYGVYKLLHIGRVPTSLKLLFWQWLMVSLVFRGQSTLTSYSSLLNPPLSTSLISLTVVKHHVYLEEYIILNHTYHP